MYHKGYPQLRGWDREDTDWASYPLMGKRGTGGTQGLCSQNSQFGIVGGGQYNMAGKMVSFKKTRLGPFPTLPLPSIVTLGRSLHLSVPHLCNGNHGETCP